MTATAHALVAGALYRAIPHPIALPIAFASHFIMDAIPHWDFGTNWRERSKTATGLLAIAETVLGITLAYFLFQGKGDNMMLLATIACGELPDWMEAPWYIFFATHAKHEPSQKAGFFEHLTYRIYRFENALHTKATFPFGLYTQLFTVGFFLLVLTLSKG